MKTFAYKDLWNNVYKKVCGNEQYGVRISAENFDLPNFHTF